MNSIEFEESIWTTRMRDYRFPEVDIIIAPGTFELCDSQRHGCFIVDLNIVSTVEVTIQ